MPQARLSMRKISEVLRLKWELGRNHREIAQSCGIGTGTVSEYVRRAKAAALEDAEAREAGEHGGPDVHAPERAGDRKSVV